MASNVGNSLLIEGISKFVTFSLIEFHPTEGGVNNIVKKALVDNRDAYILRIYNNGDDVSKVLFEHKVLKELQKQHLSFDIPFALNSSDNDGASVRLSNGSHASVFRVIPGALPKLNAATAVGAACGELTNALASVELDGSSPTAPYFEIYRVHHAIDRDLFFEEIQSEKYDIVRNSALKAIQEIRDIEVLIRALLQLDLPKQLIHGDLHYDNVLAEGDHITGVLDFEFCALDWRAMDLAITLSKYASESDPLPYFRQIISGYKQHVRLLSAEVDAITDLVILRILSNVVYFVGRALSREDEVSTLTNRLDTYMRRIDWLRTNKRNIVDCFLY